MRKSSFDSYNRELKATGKRLGKEVGKSKVKKTDGPSHKPDQ